RRRADRSSCRRWSRAHPPLTRAPRLGRMSRRRCGDPCIARGVAAACGWVPALHTAPPRVVTMATTASAYLTGFGSYLPGDSVSNDEIASRLGDDAVTERILCRVLEAKGIRQRHTTRSTSTVS